MEVVLYPFEKQLKQELESFELKWFIDLIVYIITVTQNHSNELKSTDQTIVLIRLDFVQTYMYYE